MAARGTRIRSRTGHLLVAALLLSALLDPPAQALVLTAVVEDSNGHALPGAVVELITLSEPQATRTVTTDVTGRAVLELPGPGVHSIRASLSGFLAAEIPPFAIAPGAADRELHLTLSDGFAPFGITVLEPTPAPRQAVRPVELSSKELLALQEAVVRAQVERYANLEPQFDDPVGRSFCVVLNATDRGDGNPPPGALLARLADIPSVRTLDWCAQHQARYLSVGPLLLALDDGVLIWSMSWVPSRRGSATCLSHGSRMGELWTIAPDCADGGIFD